MKGCGDVEIHNADLFTGILRDSPGYKLSPIDEKGDIQEKIIFHKPDSISRQLILTGAPSTLIDEAAALAEPVSFLLSQQWAAQPIELMGIKTLQLLTEPELKDREAGGGAQLRVLGSLGTGALVAESSRELTECIRDLKVLAKDAELEGYQKVM